MIWKKINKKMNGLWELVLQWSEHPRAHVLLCVVSFLDSSILPVSPWIMLVPMCLAKPEKAWRYVFTSSLFGMLGGMLGYALGHYLMTWMTPYLQEWGYWDAYMDAVAKFHEWGFWALCLPAFLPIPYKFFAIAAGFVHLPFWSFTFLSFWARWVHFAIIPVIFVWGALPFLKRFCHVYTRG